MYERNGKHASGPCPHRPFTEHGPVYGIALQPTLFGEVAVVRCWGRIGTRGRVKSATYANAEQAADVFAELEHKKLLRGYVATNS